MNEPSNSDSRPVQARLGDPPGESAPDATRRTAGAGATPLYHVRCPHCHEQASIPEQAFFQEIECPNCGSTFHLASLASTAERGAPPTEIGPYLLLEQLGHGQYGSVWKARDTKLDRIVALKIPRRTNLSETELEMFFREARAAAQLRHAGIVAVHDVGRDDTCVYIASEFVRGANLREWLEQRRATFREAAEICLALAQALEHAHAAGVIHRDLKPANIMIDVESHPRIMDFGMARRETGEVTVTLEGQIVGTPAYMSPEQALGEGHQADRRSDVYSLGVILYEMLTGERPFRGERQMLMLQILSEDPKPPRHLNHRIPKDLETICLKCLEKNPDRRYGSAQALAQDLRAWRDKRPIQARPVGRLGRLSRWCQRRPAVAALLAAVVLTATAGFALVSWQADVARRQAEVATGERDRAEGYLEKLLDSVDQMLVEVGASRLQDEPHMAETRRALIDEALAFYDWLAAQEARSPRVRYLHAKALVQAGRLRWYLGDELEGARRALEQADALLSSEQLPSHPRATDLVALQADTHLHMALVARNQGDGVRAWDRAQKAIQSVEALPESERRANLPTLGQAQAIRAQQLRARSDLAQAEKILNRTIELFQPVARDTSPRHTRTLVEAHHDLALLLNSQMGRQVDAEAHFRAAIELAESLDNRSVAARRAIASLLGDYANVLHRADRIEEAEQNWAQIRNIREQLVAEHPTEPEYRYGLAMYFQSHGYSSFMRERANTSLDEKTRNDSLDRFQGELDEAVRILGDLVRDYPGVKEYEDTLLNTHNLLGVLHLSRNNLSAAEGEFSRCAELLRRALAEDPQNAKLCNDYGGVTTNLAHIRFAKNDYTGALELTTEAIQFERAALESQPDNLTFQVYYRNQAGLKTNCLWRLERWDDGDAAHDEYASVSQRVFDALPSDDNRRHFARTLTNRAKIVAARHDLAEPRYRSAYEDVSLALELQSDQEDAAQLRALQAAVAFRLNDAQPLLKWAEAFDGDDAAQDWRFQWAIAAVACARSGSAQKAEQCIQRADVPHADDATSGKRPRLSISRLVAEAQAILRERTDDLTKPQ